MKRASLRPESEVREYPLKHKTLRMFEQVLIKLAAKSMPVPPAIGNSSCPALPFPMAAYT